MQQRTQRPGLQTRRPTASPATNTPNLDPRSPAYGLQAGTHPLVLDLADSVSKSIACCSTAGLPEQVATGLPDFLGCKDLLPAHQRQADVKTYRRHLLYADPAGRFSVLALVWLPGQRTLVHAHTAWGAVGVYKGDPSIICYDCCEQDGYRLEFSRRNHVHAQTGDCSWVKPGLNDIHRIYNDSDKPVITIHVYGRDLLRNPLSINIDLNLDA